MRERSNVGLYWATLVLMIVVLGVSTLALLLQIGVSSGLTDAQSTELATITVQVAALQTNLTALGVALAPLAEVLPLTGGNLTIIVNGLPGVQACDYTNRLYINSTLVPSIALTDAALVDFRDTALADANASLAADIETTATQLAALNLTLALSFNDTLYQDGSVTLRNDGEPLDNITLAYELRRVYLTAASSPAIAYVGVPANVTAGLIITTGGALTASMVEFAPTLLLATPSDGFDVAYEAQQLGKLEIDRGGTNASFPVRNYPAALGNGITWEVEDATTFQIGDVIFVQSPFTMNVALV